MQTQAFLFARRTPKTMRLHTSKTAPERVTKGSKTMLQWNEVMSFNELDRVVFEACGFAVKYCHLFGDKQTGTFNLRELADYINYHRRDFVQATYLPPTKHAPARILIQRV